MNATKGWPLLVAALMLSASACAVGSPSSGGAGARPSVAMRKTSALSFGAAPAALDPTHTPDAGTIATQATTPAIPVLTTPAPPTTLPTSPTLPASPAPGPQSMAQLEPGSLGSHLPAASVVIVGDSLAQQAAPYLQPFFGPDELVRRAFAGTAPCDWLNTDLAIQPTSIVVISFSGNSFTPCMSDGAGAFLHGEDVVANYRVTVTALITEAVNAGARVLLVGQPAFAFPQTPYNVVDGVNAMYRELAATTHVSFVDAGAAVENADGSFAFTLPCLPGESQCDAATGTNVVRSDDGVHFCPGSAPPGECPVYASGAFRVATAIEEAIRNL